MRALRVLIADDEPLIRLGIRRALDTMPGVAVSGECGTVADAVAAIAAEAPDLVVLDVQMPGGTGLDVVRALGPSRMPAVIFVTAFDAYAVQAFEVNAVDYVLKPFDPERLQQAVERARARLDVADSAGAQANALALAERLQALLAAHDAAAQPSRAPAGPTGSGPASAEQEPPVDRLVVRSAERFDLVPVDSIDWIEAADNYVRLHCGRARHVLGETLTSLERRLDRRRFLRIHRSRMVNRSRVVAVHVLLGGTYELELRDGTRVSSGRNYRDTVQKLLRS
jgi:two-component system LytT family response regulator